MIAQLLLYSLNKSLPYAGVLTPSISRALASLRIYEGRHRAHQGQGTTEYAILVGVLVVIAILAITLFRPKIQELWDSIATGINGL